MLLVPKTWVAFLLYEKKARSQMYCQSCHSNLIHLDPVQITKIRPKKSATSFFMIFLHTF